MMKINKVTLGFSIILAAGLFLGCGKDKPNVPPEPDTETQSALDATWMTYVVSDIDMMCSFLSVLSPKHHFYLPENTATISPGEGDIEDVNDVSDKRYSMVFNRTHSIDGRFRTGEVRIVYNPANKRIPQQNPNSTYYHRFGFAGDLTLSDYYIDRSTDTAKNITKKQWLVTMPTAGLINNELKDTASFNPATNKLTWKINAKFKFKHPTDSTGAKDMTWEGVLYKVLENTNDIDVYNKAKTPAITWSLATCGYYGEITGKIGSTSYKLSIKESERLMRDFTCSPDRVGGVTIDPSGQLEQRDETHHPFVKGIATFTPGDKYPRVVYFGNESNTKLAWQCDNTGEVMIKGIAYRVNFIK
jgi:hypothetical protein